MYFLGFGSGCRGFCRGSSIDSNAGEEEERFLEEEKRRSEAAGDMREESVIRNGMEGSLLLFAERGAK